MARGDRHLQLVEIALFSMLGAEASGVVIGVNTNSLLGC